MSTAATRELEASLESCLIALRRCLAFLEGLDAESYRRRTPRYSSIGEHVRHCLEYVDRFIAGAHAGEIAYDRRARSRELETDVAAARAVAAHLIDRLAALAASGPPRELRVAQIPAPDRPEAWVSSTFERELMYLGMHTIHHLAIVDVLLAVFAVPAAPPNAVGYATEVERETRRWMARDPAAHAKEP